MQNDEGGIDTEIKTEVRHRQFEFISSVHHNFGKHKLYPKPFCLSPCALPGDIYLTFAALKSLFFFIFFIFFNCFYPFFNHQISQGFFCSLSPTHSAPKKKKHRKTCSVEDIFGKNCVKMPISLFYYYADVDDVDSMAARLREKGRNLSLGGRIRVSPEGINGTFGGCEKAVSQFHGNVLEEFEGAEIDFKVSEGSAVHFGSEWRVRTCAEVVTMGTNAKKAGWRDAAAHISPEQFKDEIIQERTRSQGNVVVLDARNQYEHAIGRFDGAVLPQIRQFSEFPDFVAQNKDLFTGKRVLMYCTGGVRCERGSALVQQVTDATSVAQLQGGIDAFLKMFPNGGDVFRGKNLVFDRRMAVGNCEGGRVGKCVCCGGAWDDYSAHWRCSHCRGRVLVCDSAQCVGDWESDKFLSLCKVCRHNL